MSTDPGASPELPMHEADLSESDLDDLIGDLSACSEISFVGVKATADAPRATGLPTPDLMHALNQFLTANAHAIQIRYAYDNAHWVDTITRKPAGYRLLRIKHPGR